ncbi:hypothetical protein HJFPF1_02005 [Paramyrothecium foliicola]|nr:hypothetical protein HJFPF1_02005 [Paramyrothecium foliicola]
MTRPRTSRIIWDLQEQGRGLSHDPPPQDDDGVVTCCCTSLYDDDVVDHYYLEPTNPWCI